MIFYWALGFPTWTNDVVQQGANRPKINMFMTLGEQIIRISLVLLLIGRFQIYALVTARPPYYERGFASDVRRSAKTATTRR